MLNERYDESNRWCGNINFAGHIFPNMRNFTSNHKATSIGNQLLSNYKKFLYAYEKCYASRDLQRMPGEEVRGTALGHRHHLLVKTLQLHAYCCNLLPGRFSCYAQ